MNAKIMEPITIAYQIPVTEMRIGRILRNPMPDGQFMKKQTVKAIKFTADIIINGIFLQNLYLKGWLCDTIHAIVERIKP